MSWIGQLNDKFDCCVISITPGWMYARRTRSVDENKWENNMREGCDVPLIIKYEIITVVFDEL